MGLQECGGESVRSEVDLPEAFDDLLEAARSGQPAALTELWDRFAGGVAGFVRARGALEVDEITNDVFLAVFTGLKDFAGDASGFKALLFTVARRRVIDEQRRRGRRAGVELPRPLDDQRHGLGPEEAMLRHEASRVVLDLVNQLTDSQRDVLLLRLVADLSIDEVAATLGRTSGSVKSLQRRGLDTLRRRWPGESITERLDRAADHDPRGPLR